MKFSATGAIDVALSRRELYPIYGNRKIKDDGRCKDEEKRIQKNDEWK